MAIKNPCCCITLRTGAKIVAAVDLLVALILLIIFISDLVVNINEEYGKSPVVLQPRTGHLLRKRDDGSDSDCDDDELEHFSAAEVGNVVTTNTAYVTTGVWTILTVFLATNVGISALLYTGARNYSIKRCKWWFYIQTVITSVSLVILILILCFQVAFALVVFDLIIHLVYRMYTLWVVYLFIGELTYLDTLCSLNSSKKGGIGGGIVYPASMFTNGSSMGSTSPTSYDYYAHTNIYANTPYQQREYAERENNGPTHVHSGHITASIGGTNSPLRHYSEPDDRLSPTNPHGTGSTAMGNNSGGIDNPTYLP